MGRPERMSGMFQTSACAAIFLILVSCVFTTGCLDNVIIPVFTNPGHTHLADNEGNLSVYFLDVGQGDSTLFIVDGKTILIDAGEIDMGDRVVRALRKLGVTRIDLLVSTHPHSDHIGGMQVVLASLPVGQVLDAGIPSPSPVYEHFLETIDKKNIPYRVAERGQTIDVDPALRVLVLSPPVQRIGDDPNINSVVLRISYGTIDFLMTGDLGAEGEDALTTSGYPVEAEILKLAHHGSSSSTSPGFLDRVSPEMGIIYVGKGNPYGHPHQEIPDLLKKRGVTVYRTDRDGTIVVRTDGMSYSVKTETNDHGIWNVSLSREITLVQPFFTLPTLSLPEPVPLPDLTLPPVPSNLTITVPVLTAPQIGNASSIYISATQFDAPGDDRQNLNGEWVQLTNRGDDTVLIAGWTLSDNGRRTLYTFPAIFLVPGESVRIFSGSGTLNNTALFMGKTDPVWGNSGDLAILKDGQGAIIDQRSESDHP
ncbi:MAG: lamin tail domain-containing protein [Methanoregula sp.]|nr:lamin tail domain-containing protein [Methanoregula sp.]